MTEQISRGFIKKIAYVVLVFFVFGVILVVDVATPFGGNIRFYSEWVRCGRGPLVERALPGGGVRFYAPAPAVGIFRGYQTKYYCTPLEAEKAGLSADPHQYQFPELDRVKQK